MKPLYLPLAAALALGFATSAQAIPALQLGITGGTYDSTTQTTVASGSIFTLSAYLTPKQNATSAEIDALLADTYYISMAVVPKTGPTDATLGSFTVGATTVNVTSDMTYGTPPLETVMTQLSDPGDLAPHSIYETFYKQLAFQFNSGAQTAPFDVQTSVGAGPSRGQACITSALLLTSVVYFRLPPSTSIYTTLKWSPVATMVITASPAIST